MDILDIFPENEECLTREKENELRHLINLLSSKKISLEKYSQELIKFWKSNGFPDFSEKDLPYNI
jgi:hypothetical protein|tara:strand:- start:6712 stop:6906 length:195 start_codon:yes stop_codon:yes gene_type:complete